MTVYTFRGFVLDSEELQLSAQGSPVAVGSTDLRLLLALAERAGSVVSKADLMSCVWGRSAIGDNALHVHVAALRKIIGDDIITTKRGVGYRFAPEVTRSQTSPAVGNLSLFTIACFGKNATLVGRDSDLREISELLRNARLITLTGPGGVGKTSLAFRIARDNAHDFPDGVWVTELSSLNEPKLVPSQVAAAIGIGLGKTTNPLQNLARQLAAKSALLVLDNCEHLIGACAEICEALLSIAPKLRILVTSRETLCCAGEIPVAVQPLMLPTDNSPSADAIRNSPAIELFLARARAAVPGFWIGDDEMPIAARICRRVDGLPLAIEMVASWAGILGVSGLDEKLAGSMQSWIRARSTAPPRQSTLAATLEWSHGLLSPAEQTTLQRLSVFAGSFTMKAAEAVVSDVAVPEARVFEYMADLVRKSMVAVVPGASPPAFRLLETTRAFMSEQLSTSPDAREVKGRHADYILRTLTIAVDEWESLSDTVWLNRYTPFLPDLRLALDWATGADPELAIALAGLGWPLWREMSLHAEGRQRLNTVIGLIGPNTPSELAIRTRCGLAELCLNTESVGEAYEDLRNAVSIHRERISAPDLAGTLLELAYSAKVLGKIEEARSYLSEAIGLLKASTRYRTLGYAHAIEASIEISAGDLDAAEAASVLATRFCQLAGSDRTALVVSANLMEAKLINGDFNEAIETGLKLCDRLRTTPYADVLGFALGILTIAFVFTEQHDKALVTAREAATILREEGMMFWMYDYLSLRLAQKGRHSDAAVVLGYGNHLFEQSGRTREPIGIRAISTVSKLCHGVMPDAELQQLMASGRHLSEDKALALALNS